MSSTRTTRKSANAAALVEVPTLPAFDIINTAGSIPDTPAAAGPATTISATAPMPDVLESSSPAMDTLPSPTPRGRKGKALASASVATMASVSSTDTDSTPEIIPNDPHNYVPRLGLEPFSTGASIKANRNRSAANEAVIAKHLALITKRMEAMDSANAAIGVRLKEAEAAIESFSLVEGRLQALEQAKGSVDTFMAMVGSVKDQVGLLGDDVRRVKVTADSWKVVMGGDPATFKLRMVSMEESIVAFRERINRSDASPTGFGAVPQSQFTATAPPHMQPIGVEFLAPPSNIPTASTAPSAHSSRTSNTRAEHRHHPYPQTAPPRDRRAANEHIIVTYGPHQGFSNDRDVTGRCKDLLDELNIQNVRRTSIIAGQRIGGHYVSITFNSFHDASSFKDAVNENPPLPGVTAQILNRMPA